LPGRYTVELSSGGKSDRKTLILKPDPRARTSEADLTAQFELATRLTEALAVTYDSFLSLKELRVIVGGKAAGDATGAMQAFDKKLDAVQNGTTAAPGVGLVNRDLARYFEMLVSGDARPAERLRASVADSCDALAKSLASWRNLNAKDLPAVNRLLATSRQAPLPPMAVPATPPCAP
jgi:hypothetical protein